MESWKKQLRKMPRDGRARALAALTLLFARDFGALDRKQLKGYDAIFRIRVGGYRIIYHDDGEKITIKAIRRRNETTYRDF
ncbi:MAG: type II toxin-antitoxin system RelE/ParE family toxin [Candidatus Peribacteraceae bacterium]|jgi:mRNA-degrading endonuclease RelE of RelBE toxin-antitoxin system|nr:type II toxin-antitoxin system RelE/ParE family toxin [Candidatus Peribacteraceae bacterium]